MQGVHVKANQCKSMQFTFPNKIFFNRHAQPKVKVSIWKGHRKTITSYSLAHSSKYKQF